MGFHGGRVLWLFFLANDLIRSLRLVFLFLAGQGSPGLGYALAHLLVAYIGIAAVLDDGQRKAKETVPELARVGA